MDTKQPYALCLAEKLQDAYNATYRIKAVAELRRQHAEIETLRAGYDAARLEIASLRERVQMLGQLARDVNSRRVTELEAQLAAVGAGGVEPLRKRECLHQISEPAQPVSATPEWWRKRADEIEADVARSGSIAAMNCYTKMRQLLQAATAPQPAQAAPVDAAKDLHDEIMRLAPTDADIIALADETRTGEPGREGYILPISFARAVLAKWGAQPVAAPAGMEPVYQIGQPFLFDPENTWRDASKDAYDMHMPNRRRIIYTAAQVQAMLDVRNSDNKAAPSGTAQKGGQDAEV